MSIVTYSSKKQDKKTLITSSDGTSILSDNCTALLDFVCHKADTIAVWDLDEFAKSIFKYLPKENKYHLDKNQKTIIAPYKLFYIPDKILGINKWIDRYGDDNIDINIYGIDQYFQYSPEPTLYEIKKHTEELLEAFKLMGIKTNKLTSPISVFSDYLTYIPYAKACDVPTESEEILECCSDIMTDEWRDCYQIGHWNSGLYDYDLTGCYGYLISKLPDLTYATYIKSDTYIPNDWGIMYGEISTTNKVHPIPRLYRQRNQCGFITTEQANFLKHWNIGTFTMKYGWFIRYNTPCNRPVALPFEHIINRLYNLRSYDNQLVQWLAKKITNSIWGKFCEILPSGKLGDFFQPIYGCMVSSRASLSVGKFIYSRIRDIDSIVSVLVDGVKSTKQADYILIKPSFGHWRLNKQLPTLIFHTYSQWYGDFKSCGVSYNQIMDAINKDSHKDTYLKGAIDLGVYRHEAYRPKTGKELLENKYII